jgi:hypothetical protein
MKTSSISLAAAAVLTVASLNSAIAGGWIVPTRPSFFPPTPMIAPPMYPAVGRFGPMGQYGFQHGWGHAPPFSPFFPLGGAYFSAPGPYPPVGGAPPVQPIIWAPTNVVVVAPAPPCGYGYPQFAAIGGPKIITIGAPPPSARPVKLPIVIYGTQGRRVC